MPFAGRCQHYAVTAPQTVLPAHGCAISGHSIGHYRTATTPHQFATVAVEKQWILARQSRSRPRSSHSAVRPEKEPVFPTPC